MKHQMPKLRIIRLVGITSKNFVQNAYSSDPSLQYLDALDQQNFFFRNDSVFNDYFDLKMRELGIECQSIIHDVQYIRDAWIRASDFELTGDSDFDLIVTAVRKFGANVVFEQSAGLLDCEMVLRLRHTIPDLAIFAAHIAAPVDFDDYSQHDLVFVGCESYLIPMKNSGCKNVFLLRHGFDKRLADKYASPRRVYDLTFVGNSGYKNPSYWSRYKYLDQLSGTGLLQSWSRPDLARKERKRRVRGLAEQSKVGAVMLNCARATIGLASHLFLGFIGAFRLPWLCGDKLASHLNRYSSGYRLFRSVSFPLNWRFPQIPFYLRDDQGSHSQVFGSEMLRVLAKSKITFHRRADLVDGCAGAMRLFEATGMGAMLLTDEDSDIGLVFEPGVEVVTYSSYEDCVEKIRYYLEHESERELIAAKGQERTMKEHSLDSRFSFIAEQLLKQIQND